MDSRRSARAPAYCLVGNHARIVLRTRQPNLSRLMRHIDGIHTHRYKRRHEETGHLFQGRFNAIVVDEDIYLPTGARGLPLRGPQSGPGGDGEATWRLALLGHVSRDAPAIEAREIPVKVEKLGPMPKPRGRPNKGEVRERELTRLERR